MTDNQDNMSEVKRTWHQGWDMTVNRPNARDSLVCYCGEEVACYHQGCLAMREDPLDSDEPGEAS